MMALFNKLLELKSLHNGEAKFLQVESCDCEEGIRWLMEKMFMNVFIVTMVNASATRWFRRAIFQTN